VYHAAQLLRAYTGIFFRTISKKKGRVMANDQDSKFT
jgi:hypothetical protein